MSVEDRDWYAQSPPPPPKRFGFGSVFVLVVVFAALLTVIGLKWVRGGQSDFNGEEQSRVGGVRLTIVPGLPSLTLRKGSVYPKNDPWKDYLADERTCPGGERTDLPLDEQANVMVCLVNYARQHHGLSTLAIYPLLNNTSLLKADKIVRCNEFAHDACGEAADVDARAGGYYGAWGENLYIGEERLGAPRVAFDGWLNSPGHRENLFQPGWRSQGIAVMRVAHIGKYSNAILWVNEFAAS